MSLPLILQLGQLGPFRDSETQLWFFMKEKLLTPTFTEAIVFFCPQYAQITKNCISYHILGSDANLTELKC